MDMQGIGIMIRDGEDTIKVKEAMRRSPPVLEM
jgi:hypothetical protein